MNPFIRLVIVVVLLSLLKAGDSWIHHGQGKSCINRLHQSFASQRFFVSSQTLQSSLKLLSSSNENQESKEEETFYSVTSPRSAKKPEGYLNPDITSISDGKQIRVILYIVLALLPCLLLVPFFFARDFVPPSDPGAMIP